MELTNVQRALLQRAVQTLLDQPEYAHPLKALAELSSRDVTDEIKRRRGMYVSANREVEELGPALLSPEAALYWKEAQRVLAHGNLVLARGSRKMEKSHSRACEALEERFDERVPNSDKPKFVRYDLNRPDLWDDRWHACVDWYFPLLRQDLQTAKVIANPMGQAQLDVLRELLAEPVASVDQTERQRLLERVAELRRGE